MEKMKKYIDQCKSLLYLKDIQIHEYMRYFSHGCDKMPDNGYF